MSTVNIRPMQKQDIDQVVRIGLATHEFQTGTNAAQFYSREMLNKWVDDSHGATFVAVDGEKVVGFILGYFMEAPNDTYLNCLVVLEEYRKQGLGAELLQKALLKFERLGCDHVFGLVRDTNKSTLNLLSKNGFSIGESFRYVEIMLS